MEKRRLENLGIETSLLGYGCMRFPVIDGDGDKIDEAKSIEMIRYAIDNGVNYLDTAFFYHGGNSERLVGKALKDGYRKLAYLATKLPLGEVNCEDDVERIFNEQLEKLDTDYIDFYLMHMMSDIKVWERLKSIGIEKWIEDKKASGAIRQVGFSYHGKSDMFCKIIDAYDWDFSQIQYNYLDEHSQAGRKGLDSDHQYW